MQQVWLWHLLELRLCRGTYLHRGTQRCHRRRESGQSDRASPHSVPSAPRSVPGPSALSCASMFRTASDVPSCTVLLGCIARNAREIAGAAQSSLV